MKWICLPLLLLCSMTVLAEAARRPRQDANMRVRAASDETVIEETPTPMGEPIMEGNYEGGYQGGYGGGYGEPGCCGGQPSWYGGCCEREPSCGDHLWDNYCAEKHCGGCCFGLGRCCGKIFGCGPRCNPCCRPRLWDRCCGMKCCAPKCAPVCCAPTYAPTCCGPKCCTKRWCGPRFGLYDRCCTPKCYGGGCCEPKCGRRVGCLGRLFGCGRSKCGSSCCDDACCSSGGGYGYDAPMYSGEMGTPVNEGNVMEVPMPAAPEVNEIPVPPMLDDAT